MNFNGALAGLGWKTILGGVLYAAGQLVPMIPALAPAAPVLLAAGAVLGGVGVSHKVAKVITILKEPGEPQAVQTGQRS